VTWFGVPPLGGRFTLKRAPPEGGTPNQIKIQIIVWDTKRQIIWLVAGTTFGTFIVYMDAHDEAGRFDRSVFAFWEIILLAIILTLFYLYSRKKT
jgi:hypothetical protein